eukprot:7252751-Pyramimonas_sp.AAC.1
MNEYEGSVGIQHTRGSACSPRGCGPAAPARTGWGPRGERGGPSPQSKTASAPSPAKRNPPNVRSICNQRSGSICHCRRQATTGVRRGGSLRKSNARPRSATAVAPRRSATPQGELVRDVKCHPRRDTSVTFASACVVKRLDVLPVVPDAYQPLVV